MVDFTRYHRESGFFVCVSVQLNRQSTWRVTPSLSVHTLLIPSTHSGLDLQFALTVTYSSRPSNRVNSNISSLNLKNSFFFSISLGPYSPLRSPLFGWRAVVHGD